MSELQGERSSKMTWRLWTAALAFLVMVAALLMLSRFPLLAEFPLATARESLERPSLLLDSLRNLFLAQLGIGIALLLLMGQLLWNQSLRRAVALKTRSLREAEARYRCLVEGLDLGIALLDEEGSLLTCNDYWTDLLDAFGPSEEELSLEEAAAVRPWKTDATPRRELGSRDVSLVSREGTEHIFNIRMLSVGETEGAPLRTIELVEDVTERRQWEARLRVTERLESMGRMAGGIAHEFRNLLMGMSAGMEALKKSIPQESELMPTVRLISEAGDRAKDLVAQLLSFAGKGKQTAVELDVNQICREAASMLSHLAKPGVRVASSLEASPSRVLGDPDEIRRALLNIGINAEQATSHGGSVTIATAVRDTVPDTNLLWASPSEGPFVHILVSDTGQGMSQEVLARIFEPFFTTKEGGTGLGLPMVQGCVRSHDGALSVESLPGQGTAFHLYFPLLPSFRDTVPTTEETPSEESPRQPRPAAPSSEKSLRFSVVDDDALTRHSLAELLQAQGHRVEVFEDGPSFLRRYEDNPEGVDFVLLDIDMPKLRGDKVLEQIRKRSPLQKVILCSGSEDRFLAGVGEAQPNVSLLRKPFGLDRLLQEVERIQDER